MSNLVTRKCTKKRINDFTEICSVVPAASSFGRSCELVAFWLAMCDMELT